MTDKQALRERYSPQSVPNCHICGAEMTVQRMSASRITYGCSGATYDDKGCHYAEGRSIADDHYEQSRVTIVDVSDPDVLALLDELEADKEQIKTLESRNRRLDGIIDTAEKRIAETNKLNAELTAKIEPMDRRIAELEILELTELPGGFSLDEAKELHTNLVNSHISKAISSEKMKSSNRNNDLAWIKEQLVSAAWFVQASIEAYNAAGINIKGESNNG